MQSLQSSLHKSSFKNIRMPIAAIDKELVIAVNRHILFVDPSSATVTKTQDVDSDLLPENDEAPTGPEASECPNPPAAKDPIEAIQRVSVGKSGEYLAVTTTGRKLLLLYRVLTDRLELLSARRISRASSAITFSVDGSKILMCDKTGDCYSFEIAEPTRPGQWLFGHLSMVLDVRFAPDMSMIVTCDRDEKIRTTNYPATNEIECFCLGHTEYVSCIEFLPIAANELLVSLSGDKTISLWNYKTGAKLHHWPIPAPGVKFVLRQVNESFVDLAVLVLQQTENIFVYRLQKTTEGFESNLISSHAFLEAAVIDLVFLGSSLFLLTRADGHLQIHSLKFADDTYIKTDVTRYTQVLQSVFHGEELPVAEDVAGWFKKKFDNVSEYLERKKRRIDEKINRNNSNRCN